MKKVLALLLALAMVFCIAACSDSKDPDEDKQDDPGKTDTPDDSKDDPDDKPGDPDDKPENPDDKPNDPDDEPTVKVMSHAEFMAAAKDDPVVIETYVQATQSWWQDSITVYAQNEEGGVYIYNLTCSEEDAAKLVPGTKIRVTGYKDIWDGEHEIAAGASFQILDGSWIASPTDVTALLGTDELESHMNELVAFKGMTVEPYDDSGAAFVYKNNEPGDDIYFKVSKDGAVYEFCVESYLTGSGTPVYTTIEGWKVGDTVDLEGFLYWWNGPNPHINSATVTGSGNTPAGPATPTSSGKATPEEIGEVYIKATFTADGALMLSTLPEGLAEPVAASADMTVDEFAAALTESFQRELDFLTEEIGEWTYDYVLSRTEDGDETDIESKQEDYDALDMGIVVQDVKTLVYTATVKNADGASEDEEIEVPVIKINDKWYVDFS